jgi:kynureninase
MTTLTREDVAALDANDPLADMREQFQLPEGVIYLDGNSLGALPKATPERLRAVIAQEWGEDLIRSWNTAGWYEMPRRVGDKIAQLIGARPGEVVVADSTSINCFKVLAAALHLRPQRRVILSEPDNFPTDLYMAQGLSALLGGTHELVLRSGDELLAAIDDTTAVVLLTHANYRTGSLHDMAALTKLAQARGALVIWDLAHSAGAMPIDLTAAHADFAIGCGYKYLNGGPGAPAFLYVAKRHQRGFRQPLSGWMGHADPFAFDAQYAPANDISRYLCGTQPILSMAALEVGVDLLLTVDLAQVRAKSLAMGDLFWQLVAQRCGASPPEVVTPRDHALRGSQISFRHPEGYAIMQALIAAGVIGDFRAPDIIRFGFTPLYLRYADLWDAVTHLADILATRRWDRPQFKRKAKVT